MCDKLVMAGAIILPNIGVYVGSIAVRKNMAWYTQLNKPSYSPPNWIFCPVWTKLYCSMGYASYVVWKLGGGCHGPARLPLMVYGSHLLLNWCWTPLFFHAHKLKLSLYELIAMDATALLTSYMFYQVRPLAGLLLIPYLAWLGFATLLTYNIVMNNEETSEGAKITEIKDE